MSICENCARKERCALYKKSGERVDCRNFRQIVTQPETKVVTPESYAEEFGGKVATMTCREIIDDIIWEFTFPVVVTWYPLRGDVYTTTHVSRVKKVDKRNIDYPYPYRKDVRLCGWDGSQKVVGDAGGFDMRDIFENDVFNKNGGNNNDYQ